MMYYLNQKNYKVLMIVSTVIFLPMILCMNIACCLTLSLVFLYISIPFIVIYLIFVAVFFKCSKDKRAYLLLKEDEMQIRYFDSRKGVCDLSLLYTDIECISYTKIISKRTFLNMLLLIILLPLIILSYEAPSIGLKSVYVTYRIGLIEKRVMIGYLDYKEIKQICEEKNIKLVV